MKDLDYYMNLNYRIEVIREVEDNGYVLHCPDLPGCITSADTIEEGMEMIEDAKKCWISASMEDGRTIPEPTENYFIDNRFYTEFGSLSEPDKNKVRIFVNDLLLSKTG